VEHKADSPSTEPRSGERSDNERSNSERSDTGVRGSGGGSRALIVDWGGVLTSDVDRTMGLWAGQEQLDMFDFGLVMRDWLGREAQAESFVNPVHALERGEIEVPDFEIKLAEGLAERAGRPISPQGLIERLFQNFTHAHDMTALVRRAKAAGIKTAMLSNSWGEMYPEHLFDGMFDVIVISGRVGMRKPEPRIYHHTVELLEVEPGVCVFVDDMPHNVVAAVNLGMVGIHHVSYEQTATELDVLFDVRLSG